MRRRRAIIILAGVLTAGAALGFPILRRERSRRLAASHRPGPPDPTPPDPEDLASVAALTGALFGHRLDRDEMLEVGRGLALLAESDRGWRTELAAAGRYADRTARARGAATFADAPDPVRYDLIDSIMGTPVDSRRSRLLALFSADERDRRLTRSALIPALAQVYRASGPAWRRRGYTRWPGVPGDPREYTRPGPAIQC
jgi:hypothetical protein